MIFICEGVAGYGDIKFKIINNIIYLVVENELQELKGHDLQLGNIKEFR